MSTQGKVKIKQAFQERLFDLAEGGGCGHPISVLLASLIAWSQLPDLHHQQVGRSRGDAELSLSLSLSLCLFAHIVTHLVLMPSSLSLSAKLPLPLPEIEWSLQPYDSRQNTKFGLSLGS